MAESIHSIVAPSTLTSSLALSRTKSIKEEGPPSRLFSKRFHQRGDPEVTRARNIYLKAYIGGLFTIILAVFAVFPIYWGSLWKVPAHPLTGWIVDFDGGNIGLTVTQQLTAVPNKFVRWTVQPSSRFPEGPSQVASAVMDDQTWVAITINGGVSDHLATSITWPDPLYNGSDVITMYGAEARNENAFRSFIRPFVQSTLDSIQQNYAVQQAANLSAAVTLTSLMSVSPQTVVSPVSYTMVNLLPFNQPVASAVTFVGLIYLLIMSFFVVAVAHGAREASRFNQILRYRSLVIVRLVSSFIGYFLLSLFYSLLSLAFQIDLTAKYGSRGFMVFWMLNWIGMLSVGLALESLITILTTRYIPFFMLLLIIANVSVCIFPIEILPRIYHYGYGAPFFNVSQSIRTIVFGTKNTLGQNFGVLIAWVTISCISLLLFQWHVRRKAVAAEEEEYRIQTEAHSA
ncbi:hypothetical protein BYT27DRAFT_7094861 [Phlegmacium glaucopus]|nr:hypothetical protein BYT27DRAFT_7094861 [Phlegmacium glaucopus]